VLLRALRVAQRGGVLLRALRVAVGVQRSKECKKPLKFPCSRSCVQRSKECKEPLEYQGVQRRKKCKKPLEYPWVCREARNP
jgi:hypothetical protein